MSKKYWLSYSGFDTYKKCPKKYHLSRVLKEDPPGLPESRHNALVGSVVQRVYEDFYNKEVWRAGQGTSQRLLDLTHTYFYEWLGERDDKNNLKNPVNWRDPSCRMTQEEALALCKEMVIKTLTAIKREKLLGPYAQSEVVMRVQFQGNYYLYGKVDFLIRKADGTILLLDGKASKHRDKFVDKDQVLFYGMAFHLQHFKIPDKMGFLYYHFADDPELSLEWVPSGKEEFERINLDLLNAFGGIRRKEFKATPTPSYCKYCPWEAVCPERQAQKNERANTIRENRVAKGEPVLPTDEELGTSSIIGFGGVLKKG